MERIMYYDRDTGWTEYEGTLEESINQLVEEDGAVIEKIIRRQDMKIVLGNVDGDEFTLISTK